MKGELEGVEREYEQFTLKAGKIFNKNLTEKVGSDKGKLVPTDIGNIVNDFLVANFSNILDFGFTAKVEADFDDISEGEPSDRIFLNALISFFLFQDVFLKFFHHFLFRHFQKHLLQLDEMFDKNL